MFDTGMNMNSENTSGKNRIPPFVRAGCDNDFHTEHHRHDARHRERHAARRRIVALAALLYIR
jgi:hypothetical protein